jgi:galactokinase
MDQMASLHGAKGYALLFDCRSLTIEKVPVPQDNYVFLVVNSKIKHSHAGGEYVVRKRSCEQVASLLAKTSLRDISMRELESCQTSLPEDLYRIARHVLSENERTLNAAEALKRGDIAVLGALMTQVCDNHRISTKAPCNEFTLKHSLTESYFTARRLSILMSRN